MSRSPRFAGLLLLLLLLGCARHPAGPSIAAVATMEAALRVQVLAWLDQAPWVRPDGYGYAVDLGQLLIYAARARERTLYLRLREVLLRDYVIRQPCDVTTRGMLAWRWQAGEQPEASGTTEALRTAQGLWEGGRAFGDAQDLRQALQLLRGYLTHQCSDKGLWFIRNYFNLGTRTFATNSFLLDYDADLLRELGEALGDRELLEAAGRTDALVRQAQSPAGLLYEVIQPEIGTLLDGRLTVFSPNDEVSLANSAAVAERAVRGATEVGRQLLRRALAGPDGLHAYYLGRSGEGLGAPADVTVRAALLRLALRLHDRPAADRLLAEFLPQVQWFLGHPQEPRLFAASELLLALQAARDDLAPLPPPPALPAMEDPGDEGPVPGEDGLSPLAAFLYHLFLEIQPPQARDGQRCNDPALLDLAILMAESIAPEVRVQGWAAQPAHRMAVRQKIERHLRAVKVERERLVPLTGLLLDRLARFGS